MQILTYKTPLVSLNDSLESHLKSALPPLQEGDIVVITSKIVSLCEGYVCPKEDEDHKQRLIEKEADAYLHTPHSPYGTQLTLKHHMLIPAAGIDESNAPGNYYILFPPDPMKEAETIWRFLKNHYGLKQVGVILTDSHTTPLRRGVLGIGLAWCGFQALVNKIGEKDLFGRSLKMTTINVLDALSATAVFSMGEGKEQTPLALMRHIKNIQYSDHPPDKDELNFYFLSFEDDLYGQLFKNSSWRWRDR
jgi:putative folate metabolism gamma-glutamate ligase